VKEITNNWHSISIKEAAESLETDLSKGLDSKEAGSRLQKFGLNKLVEEKKLTFLSVAFREIREPMILLLLVVGAVYSFWGELRDAITIFAIITVLVFVEVFTEFRAKKAINALKKLTEPNAIVIRDSDYKEIPAAELVPGDILVLKVGQRIPADARLFECYGLAADESSLTGESVPVEKDANALLPEKAQLFERKNMVFSGSVITKGRGKAIVAGTGMKTELGHIAGMVYEAKIEKTPLQKLMRELTKWMVWVALFFSILIPLIGILRGHPVKEMVLTGLALSFAVIPEELPIVITMVLALGAFALSKKNALVKKLDAAETVGSVAVICSDKTGTLTENKMQVSKIFIDRGIFSLNEKVKSARFLLESAIMCNDVLIKDSNIFVGDPTQIAGLNAAIASGIDISKTKETYGRLVNEFSFDSERKIMSSVFFNKEGYVFAAGAPEILLGKCNNILILGKEKRLTPQDEEIILKAIDKMSKDALRVISFAYKKIENAKISQKEAESGLTFIGMLGLRDPPRENVKEAVAECHNAGIRVIMMTGDHADTAKSVAQEVGIDSSKIITGKELDKIDDKKLISVVRNISVFARISPVHKLRIVNALKEDGQIVAVTGDGINDAPALSSAHIGIAMGETGTDVAKEASGMILTDDNFSTIVRAAKEGRKIFDNLKKGIRYYLSCKLALISIFLLPVLIGVSLPFAPIQIILLELFMDITASTGFATEPAEFDIMNRSPRNPKEKFLNRKMISSIAVGAACLVGAVLFTYFWSIHFGADVQKAQTIAFSTWILGHICLAINMRSERELLYKLGFLSNKIIVIWSVIAVLTLIAATNIGFLEIVLKTASLNTYEWQLVVAAAFVSTFWMEIRKYIIYEREQ